MAKSNPNSNMEQGKEGKRSEALRKQATSAKGRHNQPKGEPNKVRPTKNSKFQKSKDTSKESSKEMMF